MKIMSSVGFIPSYMTLKHNLAFAFLIGLFQALLSLAKTLKFLRLTFSSPSEQIESIYFLSSSWFFPNWIIIEDMTFLCTVSLHKIVFPSLSALKIMLKVAYV